MTDYNWNQAGQGAVGGAMTGAALGSIGGPIGTGIGAGAGFLLGGAAGLFGGTGEDYESRLRKLSEGYGSLQAGPASQGAYSDFRRNQAGLVTQLEAMARGQGPSAAAIQMREAMDRAAGAQASAVAGAGGRGVNAGAALRGAMNNTAAIQAQGARDTSTLRAQEQMNAMGQLGQVTAQGRAADENMNQFNAQSQNQMSQFNVDAQFRHRQMQMDALLAAAGQQKPGIGTQLLGAGAQAIGPAMQYSMGQQQMQQNGQYQQAMLAQQQQQMAAQQAAQRQQQQLQAMRGQVQATPSTPNSGWGYSQPQQPGMNYWGSLFMPQILGY